MTRTGLPRDARKAPAAGAGRLTRAAGFVMMANPGRDRATRPYLERPLFMTTPPNR